MPSMTEHELQMQREEHDHDNFSKRVSIVISGNLISTTNPVPIQPPASGALPVSVDSLPLPTGASTSAKQDTGNAYLGGIAGLVPSAFDYISLSYTGSNLTGVVYKLGGSGGTTVATLTLAYSGSNLTSVTKT